MDPAQNKDAATPAPQQGSSLDASAGSLDSADIQPGAEQDAAAAAAAAPKKKGGAKALFSRINLYLSAFVLILLIAVIAVVIGIDRGRKANEPQEISVQDLSEGSLDSLNASDIKIGDPQQTLSVESNAIFAGRVLIQGGVDVAGTLKVGGSLSLTDIVATGTGTFNLTQTTDLAVSGNAGIQGQVTIQQGLAVSGGASFGGPVSIPQLTVDNLTLTRDLLIGRHIDAGGNTPERTNGAALGAGGTSSISGTDTAGTVTIATGGSPAPGCFMSANFSQSFSGTPHMTIAPINQDTADLNYYITRSATGFSICATNPAAGKSYAFDYIVID